MNRKDWKLVLKLQREDQEAKALAVLDNMLGLPEMTSTEKFDFFASWISEHDPSKLIRMRTDATGKHVISLNDEDIEVRDLGVAGVIDILETRALCFSSMVFGSREGATQYLDGAIENSLLIRSLFMNPDTKASLRLWELAAQPLLCSSVRASMGIDMLCTVIKANPKAADEVANQLVIKSMIPQLLAQLPPDNPAHRSWAALHAVLSPPPTGMFARLFKR